MVRIIGTLAEHLDSLRAHLFQVDAQTLQHAGGDTFAFAHQTQQEMLGADVVVAQAARLVDGQLNDLLRTRSQANLADDHAVAAANDELDRTAHAVKFNTQIGQHTRSDAIAFAHQAKQEVLGTDVIVIEPGCFLLSKS